MVNLKKHPRLNLLYLITFIITLFACGADTNTVSTNNGQGDIVFSLKWETSNISTDSELQTPNSELSYYAPQIDCAALGVLTITANVYDSNQAYLINGGPWDCTSHSGTITNVPAGANRKITVYGKDASDKIIYRGEVTGVTIIANQTTNAGSVTMTSIASDTTAPIDGSLSATGGNSQVSLSWSGFSDSGGIDYYRLVYSTSSTPSSCSSGTQIYLGAGTSYTQTGLTNNTAYYYRICAVDKAGNTSNGATTSATPQSSGTTTTADATAPSSPSVSINSGAASTTSTSVTLTLSATDNVGVTGYYASETSTTPSASASAWTSVTSTTSYSGSVSFTLSSGSGTKIVYVWFKDSAGNVSAVVNDSITFGSAPSAPTGVTATAGSGQVSISWSSVSGATSYNIYWSTSSGVTKTTGTKITGATSPYAHTGLTNGTTYYYVATAVNSYGESGESSQVSGIPQAATTIIMEDLTTYTSVDPNSRFTITSNRITYTGLTRNETAYVYKDYGINFFNADFTHFIDIQVTSSPNSPTGNSGAFWGLANNLNDIASLRTADQSHLAALIYNDGTGPKLYLEETDGTSDYFSTSYVISLSTTYYLKIVRDEGVGTYGTLYCYIYSDSTRTNLLNTQSITLHSSKKDFRYLYVTSSYNEGSTNSQFGYAENFIK